MKPKFQEVDIAKKFIECAADDHRIGDQIFLVDYIALNSKQRIEFVAPANIFVEAVGVNGMIAVNGNKFLLEGHCLIAFLRGQTVQFFVTGRRGMVRAALFYDAFLEDILHSTTQFSCLRTSIILNPVLTVGEEQANGLEVLKTVLLSIASRSDNHNYYSCAKFAILTLFFGPLYELLRNKFDAETARSQPLSSRFLSLVEKNYQTEHNLAFYAEELHISRTYLYECVVSTTGKAPSYWIDYYMISYAKKQLADFDLSILQVATDLNFAGLPQFSKFFRKQTGISPSEFRRSLL